MTKRKARRAEGKGEMSNECQNPNDKKEKGEAVRGQARLRRVNRGEERGGGRIDGPPTERRNYMPSG